MRYGCQYTSGVRTVGTGRCARYRLRIRGKEGTSESEREHLQRADFPSESCCSSSAMMKFQNRSEREKRNCPQDRRAQLLLYGAHGRVAVPQARN